VNTILEPLGCRFSRWVDGPPEVIDQLPWGHGLQKVRDTAGRLVALFHSQFDLDYCKQKWPDVKFEAFG
jgi:peptide subunit release factor RF-3